MFFLIPSRDEPDESGVTLRPWSRFQRVLADLQDRQFGLPRAGTGEIGYGSGYSSAPAAASGADGSGGGFPHTPHGSGYGLDPAAAVGASRVSARFLHAQAPSGGHREELSQTTQSMTDSKKPIPP